MKHLVALSLACWACVVCTSPAQETQVIIVGGGAAGLGAAQHLITKGISFILLEANSKLGGRVRHETINGATVETGAAWIRGPPSLTLSGNYPSEFSGGNIFDRTMNLQVVSSNFSDVAARPQVGLVDAAETAKHVASIVRCGEDSATTTWSSLAGTPATSDQSLSSTWASDCSYVAETPQLNGKYLSDEISKLQIGTRFGKQPAELSTLWSYPADAELLDEASFVIDSRGFSSSFDNIMEGLDATKFQLKLSASVVSIVQQDDKVTVETADGGVYEARYCISALPLGVIKTDAVSFVPALSQAKLDAINAFDISFYEKVTVQFPTKFWGDKEFLVFTNTNSVLRQAVNLDSPNYLTDSRLLQFQVFGSDAQAVLAMSSTQLSNDIQQTLQLAFPGVTVPQPTVVQVTNFTGDKLSLGAFSSWPIGYTKAEHDEMIAPVGNVYFAGEHTSSDYLGLVHGAYNSGYSAAHTIANFLTLAPSNAPSNTVPTMSPTAATDSPTTIAKSPSAVDAKNEAQQQIDQLLQDANSYKFALVGVSGLCSIVLVSFVIVLLKLKPKKTTTTDEQKPTNADQNTNKEEATTKQETTSPEDQMGMC